MTHAYKIRFSNSAGERIEGGLYYGTGPEDALQDASQDLPALPAETSLIAVVDPVDLNIEGHDR